MLRKTRWMAGLLALWAVSSTVWGQPGRQVRGMVKDASGAVIARARVVLQTNGRQFSSTTQADGSFVFSDVNADSGHLIVNATGFATATIPWSSGQTAVTITMSPAAVQQSLDVTATRTAILPTGVDDVEAQPDAAIVPSTQLEQWGAQATDDKLRQVAGFSLLRRSGSQTANPTSQGVSLRGLGASGASRGLVLWDGIPLNDPFGGWIFWARVPQASLDQVQLIPGGVSALYGNDALGGVINLERRSEVQTSAFIETSYGNENSPFGSGWGVLRAGQWSVSTSGEGFRTDGYTLVPKNLRGSIDTPANVQYGSGDLRVERLFGSHGRAFLEGSLYGEDRQNGKVAEVNDATIRELIFGSDYDSPSAGLFTLRLFGGTQNYHQTFVAVAPDRNSGYVSDNQHVPAQQIGMIAQWSKRFGNRTTLLAGLDGSEVQGTSFESTFSQSRHTANLSNGGAQQSLGALLQAIFQISPRWSVTAAGREDLWSNYDGLSTTIPVHGQMTQIIYPARGQNSFNPRLTTSYRASDHVVLYASGYRSFRAPTLNELYRPFRLGNTQTLANAFLRAEHFAGGEAGLRATMLQDRISLHGNFFFGYVTDPVENVTISSTPNLIVRMRENLGRTRSVGTQAGIDFRASNRITFSATYQFVNSVVASYYANPALVGNLIPLVPQNTFTFQGTWAAPKRFLVALQGRTASNEFDDDQNLLPLGSYFVLSASVSHPLPKGFDVYVAGDNLTNNQYYIARTPTANVGQPIAGRIGVRWRTRD
jgi:outer membrane receptor protein involved in Fe transport